MRSTAWFFGIHYFSIIQPDAVLPLAKSEMAIAVFVLCVIQDLKEITRK